MSGRKLIVLFPGGRYSVDMPLLYYANFIYEVKGYESLKISYGDYYKEGKSFEECIKDTKKIVLGQVSEIDFSIYEDIVFVSKSMGTVIAGWLEQALEISVRHIYLTPLKETFPYLTKEQDIIVVIAGTKDKQLGADILRKHCDQEGISLKQIREVGHRLEVFGDMSVNIDILKEVIALY